MKRFKYFNVNFADCTAQEFNDVILKDKYFAICPSGPGLATLDKDDEYRQSIEMADIASFDSGFLVLILLLKRRIFHRKLSGLAVLRDLVRRDDVLLKTVFVCSSTHEMFNIQSFFREVRGLKLYENQFFVAPMYTRPIIDRNLVSHLQENPSLEVVIICLGSNVQEPLGAYIKKEVPNRTILCTGAALSFIYGADVKIPELADKFFLGWFMRIIFAPKLYFNRYFKAIRLMHLPL